MNDSGVAAILRRLDIIEYEHSDDMEALNVKIEMLIAAHRSCSSRCWVPTDEQIRASVRRSATNMPAIPEPMP